MDKTLQYKYLEGLYNSTTSEELLRLVARMVEFPNDVIIEDSVENKELIDDILWKMMWEQDSKIFYENDDFIICCSEPLFEFGDENFLFLDINVYYKHKIKDKKEVEYRRINYNFEQSKLHHSCDGLNFGIGIFNCFDVDYGGFGTWRYAQDSTHLRLSISSLTTISAKKYFALVSNERFLKRIGECGLEVIKNEVLAFQPHL